jgi:hypothetical protein
MISLKIIIFLLLSISVNSRIHASNDTLKNNCSMDFNWTLTYSECRALQSFTIFHFILFIVALSSSICVIWVLLKYRKELLNRVNQVQLTLVIFNLFGTVISLPLVIITLFNCKYKYLKISILIQ